MYLRGGKVVTVLEDHYSKVTAICRYNNCECKVLYSEHEGGYCYINTTTNCIVSKIHNTLGNLIFQNHNHYTPFYDGVEIELRHYEI